VLRNQVDPQDPNTEGATRATLLRLPVAPTPAPQHPAPVKVAVHHVAAPRDCVGVIDGAHSTQECF